MSRENSYWLNNYTLIGHTDQRGPAWHYRLSDQGDESNHYPGAIPVDDVIRRLFNFDVIEAPVTYVLPYASVPADSSVVTVFENETGERFAVVASEQNRKGMLASDNLYDFGAFKDGYQGHAYREWLIDNVASILSDDINIGSAGLLKNRGQAWLSIEMPETIHTPEGFDFRPFLLAYSSFDGTLATNYGRKITAVVCDNTLDAARGEQGQSLKVRHTKYSALRLHDAREALGIVHTMADDFAREVARLTATPVSDKAWNKILDLTVPVPEDEGRGKTVAETKRGELISLWSNDERVAPWTGTAFGVLQAFNTWNHHSAQVRKGVPRFQRNMENVLSDKFTIADRNILSIIEDTAGKENKRKGILVPA